MTTPKHAPDAPESGVRLTYRPRVENVRRLRLVGPIETHDVERPATRGDCVDMPRPCPFVSCRYHLYLDVTDAGNIRLNYPGFEVDEMPGPSCALDVADAGDHTLEEVGEVLNVVRERVRQLEEQGLRAFRNKGGGR